MERILLIKDLDSEIKVDLLDAELKASHLDYRISLANHGVIIEGSSDDIYLAKTIIQEAGFKVE